MSIPAEDLKLMEKMVKEGQDITHIWESTGKKYDYWEIYWSLSDTSIRGNKVIISNRLKTLREKYPESSDIIDEINESVWSIYESAKSSSSKLGALRNTLNSY